MIILLPNRTEILLKMVSSKEMLLRYWICSIVYENNIKYFYFGLTFFGLSVTIKKTKKTLKDI